MIAVYQTEEFEEWLDELADRKAQGVIRDRLLRLEGGNEGEVKFVGGKVTEMIIGYGPGYRLYSTRVGPNGVAMLWGGTKRTQRRDIARAKRMAASVGTR